MKEEIWNKLQFIIVKHFVDNNHRLLCDGSELMRILSSLFTKLEKVKEFDFEFRKNHLEYYE